MMTPCHGGRKIEYHDWIWDCLLIAFPFSDNDDCEDRVGWQRDRDSPSSAACSVVVTVIVVDRRRTTQRADLVGGERVRDGWREVGEGGGTDGQDAVGPGGAHGRVRRHAGGWIDRFHILDYVLPGFAHTSRIAADSL